MVTATSHPNAEAFDADSPLVIERIPEKTLFLPTRRAQRVIEEAIERHQPDLVLLDPAWPLGLLGPRLSVPYGVIAHGAEITVPGRIPIVASTLRYVLKNAAVVICAGSYPESEVRRIAAEWAPHGVLVNAVCPGQMDTDMIRQLFRERAALRGIDEAEVRSGFEARIPVGHLGPLDHLAGTYVYLASDLSRYVTGQSITVDGGWQVG